MIILGDRYSFNQIEKERINKKFNSVNYISYKKLTPQESINKIENYLHLNDSRLIVLNTKTPLSPRFIIYLTRLEVYGVKYITIEYFMEKYLHKCLISDEAYDINFLDEYTISQYIQKRVVDYISIILLLVPTLLAIIYSKYKIEKESPGPLFFKQKRVGQEGCEFKCIKLRSMHLDAEKNGPQFATDNDPRTFPWGNTIRYTKIDELIQIWNVFKGHMHFVGPRPERKIWITEFEKTIPDYSQRHVVAPGITGLAQIKYHYGSGQLDAKEKLGYDLYYIKHWSIFLEIKIIWETAIFILRKRGKK